MRRRDFLQKVSKYGLAVPFFMAGASAPSQLWAAWNEIAFREENYENSVQKIFGSTSMEDSQEVEFKMPRKWADGGNVPIEISTTLKKVKSFTIFVEKNPTPLTAIYEFGQQSLPFIATNIKVDGPGTSDVIVVSNANGKLYRTTKTVTVMVGGCS